MGWATRLLGAALSLMLLAGSTFAQRIEDQKELNLNALGTALARHIVSSTPLPADSVFGALTDLNTDRYPELFVYRPAEACSGPDCGFFLLSLAGDEVTDLFANVSFARLTPPDQMAILNQKRGGWFDISFNGTGVSWDGKAYAELTQFQASTPSLDRFQSVCEGRRNRDYEFQQAGVQIAAGRKTLCACIGNRLQALGFDQPALDSYTSYIEAVSDIDYGNDAEAETNARAIGLQARDAEQGCMVQNQWAVWDWPFTQGDSREAQVPLVFDDFVAQCAKADWLDDNRHVGTPARRLGTCGCLARRLAASGFEQDALDAVGKLYGGAFSESDVEAVRAGALDISDAQIDLCLSELPVRPKPAN